MSTDMLKGVHRRTLGISHDEKVMAKNGFVGGGDGKPSIVMPGDPDTVAYLEDFLGDLLPDEVAVVSGDTGQAGGALANVSNGVARLTGSETQPTVHTANIAMTQGLFKQWRADMGGRRNGRLRLHARIKAAAISTVAESGRAHIFVGFSDSGGAETPAYDTGAGVISNASDLVGFLYAPTSASYSDRWQCIGAKSVTGDSGDLLSVPADAIAPQSNVYSTLELEVRNGIGDTGGVAHFWVNGKKVATLNSPVKSDAALTPWIGAWMQDTGLATQLDIDLLALSAPRDTGE